MNDMSLQSVGSGWEINVIPHAEHLSSAVVREAQVLLERWAKVFPLSNTWVGHTYGVPSLFVRLDCVVADEKLEIYEVEERPCGLGLTQQMNPQFAEHLAQFRSEWPTFSWVSTPERRTDDELWLGVPITLEDARRSRELVLVRARPEQDEYHALESRAVSSVSQEGNKEYGISLGFWSKLEWIYDREEQRGGYIGNLPDYPIVVKPLQGTRARMVKVFSKKGYAFPHTKSVKFGELERLVQRHSMIAQPFISPMEIAGAPGQCGIYRIYFGWAPSRGEYLPMGGMWMARRDPVVHGTDDAVCGPLYLS